MKKVSFWYLAALICVFLVGQALAADLPKGTSALQGEPSLQGPQRSSEIVGKSVTNPENERLGKITDLIIGQDGMVKYAILSHGGVLGLGDKLIPIPWKALERGNEKWLKPPNEEKALSVNITKKTLAKAPNFDPKQWPNFNEPEWQKKVAVYYELPPSGTEFGMPASQGTQ